MPLENDPLNIRAPVTLHNTKDIMKWLESSRIQNEVKGINAIGEQDPLDFFTQGMPKRGKFKLLKAQRELAQANEDLTNANSPLAAPPLKVLGARIEATLQSLDKSIKKIERTQEGIMQRQFTESNRQQFVQQNEEIAKIESERANLIKEYSDLRKERNEKMEAFLANNLNPTAAQIKQLQDDLGEGTDNFKATSDRLRKLDLDLQETLDMILRALHNRLPAEEQMRIELPKLERRVTTQGPR